MAPDRILAAAEEVRAEAHQLRADVERFEASQRRKNRWLTGAIAGVFVLTIVVAGLLVYSVRSHAQDNRERCEQTAESRTAIKEAFGKLPKIGAKFLDPHDRLLVELRKADADLHASLPQPEC